MLPVSFIQLALTGAPPGSDIFLFTDATAKDDYLLDAVIALVERTKSVVSIVLCPSKINIAVNLYQRIYLEIKNNNCL